MTKPLVKFAAYAIMILGILFALALILFAVLLFVLFPEGNMTKMTLTAIGLVILSAITGLVGYAVFEAMTKVAETSEVEGRKYKVESDTRKEEAVGKQVASEGEKKQTDKKAEKLFPERK